MTEPDNTAVRVALWRALHLELDAKPHILDDTVGMRLVAPPADWRQRPDMDPMRTRTMRASIVVRARFIEDLVEAKRPAQYVLLGAGLDSFAQRESPVDMQVFEVEQPGTQAWKQARLKELGFAMPAWLHFVPVDFAAGQSWLDRITASGFDRTKSAVVTSTGVIMYLTREAIVQMFREVASLKDVTLACSFILPIELIAEDERMGMEMAKKGAAAAGTPFLSFFDRESIVKLALEAGFKKAHVVTSQELNDKYFKGRSDGLVTGTGEEILVATT
ncbi:MAG: class I SAM-dependent methyltransferase [Kofleriaceae bacterium]